MAILAPRSRKSSRHPGLCGGVTLIALLGVLACTPREPQAVSRPPIVLVTLDTLRADHLGCYGYFRETSPNLDRLAAQGIVFEKAYAPIATTLPAHLSLFTGLYPHQHGLLENRIRGRPFVSAPNRRTVAELLKRSGYRTAAFVSGAPLKKFTGIGAGFDHFVEPRGYERLAERTVDRALAWLDEQPQGEAFFLWVHLWDAHEPNQPQPALVDSLPRAREELAQLVERRHIRPDRIVARFGAAALRRFFDPERGKDEGVPEVNREAFYDLFDRYDADVLATDQAVGRLVTKLEAMGIGERTIVAVVADHGQSLGQHDWLPHGEITNENLHVPAIIRYPPGLVDQPRRIATAVSTIDFMPTVLSPLRGDAAAAFAAQAEGRSALLQSPTRTAVYAQRTINERRNWEPGRLAAMLTDRFKYTLRDNGEEKLFDLDSDPLEEENVIARFPAVATRLRKELEAVQARRPAPPRDRVVAVPAEHEEALRALGYIETEDDTESDDGPRESATQKAAAQR